MIKLLIVSFLLASDGDSLRMETINGKQFIIHQIEAKETLYSISRRYSVAVTSIIENNNSAEGSLAVGQLLKIPYLPKGKTSKPMAVTELATVPPMKSVNSMHTVAAKETLYSISKQYSISVDQLKQWNGLTSDELKLGQQLIVVQPKYQTTEAVKPPVSISNVPVAKSASAMHTVAAKETLYSVSRQYSISVEQLKLWNNLTTDELKLGQQLIVIQPKYQSGEIKSSEPKVVTQTVQVAKPTEAFTPIKISEKVIGTDEVKQDGACDLMDGTEGTRKYLALHRTAKIGSILKIRNQQTNREVFVRVMGVLPAEAPSDLVIKISKAAYDRLGASEGKFKVEVTYYQ
jgi:LysM repeat protein